LYQTTNAIFHEILLSLNSIVTSKSNYDLTKRLKAKIKNFDFKLNICLDHLEHLKEMETLDRILSLGLGLIIISESFETYKKLNQAVKANIANIIEIPTYTPEQAFNILMERCEDAFEKYAYSEETIRKIAESSHGNITLALNLLKSLAIHHSWRAKEVYGRYLYLLIDKKSLACYFKFLLYGCLF